MSQGRRRPCAGSAAIGLRAAAAARLLLVFCIPFALGAASAPSTRFTIEVDWSVADPSATPPTSPELSLSEGRIVETISVRPNASGDGTWRLGPISNVGRSGRIRARIEAPLSAAIAVKVGDQVTNVPAASLLEGPARTVPPTRFDVEVERLPWDAIDVSVGGFDGIATPGTRLPITVGFNVLSVDSPQVPLRFSAILRPIRGGEPIWRHDQQEFVPTNPAGPPPSWVLQVPAPEVEGTYRLEILATWESPSAPATEGSRIARLLRRRKPSSVPRSSERSVTFTVLDPSKSGDRESRASARAVPPASPTSDPMGAIVQILKPHKPPRSDKRSETEFEADSVDLARPKPGRVVISGRSKSSSTFSGSDPRAWPIPELAARENARRDGLRAWMNRAGGELHGLPSLDSEGAAWLAAPLKIPHPDRPHRLSLTVTGGHPGDLGVALLDRLENPRVLLDARASGPPILSGDRPATFSWLVWPGVSEPVFFLVNRSTSASVKFGAVSIHELPGLPDWAPARDRNAELDGRYVGLSLSDRSVLGRFGSASLDDAAALENLGEYAEHCGASRVALSEAVSDRARRFALEGQAEEDSLAPDLLDLAFRVLSRRGIRTWLDLSLTEKSLPGLPPLGSAEAVASGIALTDRLGNAGPGGFNVIHPKVREAVVDRVAESVVARKSVVGFEGVALILGGDATLLGPPYTGLDDATFARFVSETFDADLGRSIPGLSNERPERFGERAAFLESTAKQPWFAWRARELSAYHSAIAEAVRKAAPEVRFAIVTPGEDRGPLLEEIRRIDLAGLGPEHAWRAFGIDLSAKSSSDATSIVFRGVSAASSGLERDLAAGPELDEQVAARPDRGLWVFSEDRRRGESTVASLRARSGLDDLIGDEVLCHAVSALDVGRVFVEIGALSGHEERLGRFADRYRGIPTPPLAPVDSRIPLGVAARSSKSEGGTVLTLSNDTPYPLRVETLIDAKPDATYTDLARGRLVPEKAPEGTRIVLDLPAFGFSSIAVDSDVLNLVKLKPYPSRRVLDGMQAQFGDLSRALQAIGKPNLRSKPEGSTTLTFEASENGVFKPIGWKSLGDHVGISIDRDRPRFGSGSLAILVEGVPGWVESDPIALSGNSEPSLSAWIRADRESLPIRVRLEGFVQGQSTARRLEVSATSEWTRIEFPVPLSAGSEAAVWESAQIKIEPLAVGRLWIDEIELSGGALDEQERLNAKRDLMAALSAYRDGRYADFARLAGSRWARRAMTSSTAIANRSEPARRTNAEVIRTGDVSPLPAGRRLR